MNNKNSVPRFAAVIFILVLILSLTGCAKPVEVPVSYSGRSLVAEGNEEMTVKELLQQAGVTINEYDKVSPPRDTVWKDAEADAISVRSYAKVTVTDGKQTNVVELYDSSVNEAISYAGFNASLYTVEEDLAAPLTDGMVINLIKADGGFVNKDGKLYYYQNGEKQTDAIVGDEDGVFYADSEGVIDKGYCDGVTVGGENWNIINGEAFRVDSDSDETLFRALQVVAKCTDSSMSKSEKLKASFDYLKDNYLEGSRRGDYREMDWPSVYADDRFVHGKGDCYSYAAAFAYMARGIGYEESYVCNSGGHGWAEIDGLIYDPEWSMHNFKYTYYGMTYDEPCDQAYGNSFSRDVDWQYVKIIP